MIVTYLIGNGFDISCGLKTSYADFIQAYLKTDSTDGDIIDFKSKIEKNLTTWADAELAFGAITENIQNVPKLKKCFRDFHKQLCTYLKEEQSKMNYASFKRSEALQFISGIKNFQSFLPEKSKYEVGSCLECTDMSKIKYNFLVYNYTDVFETLLKKSISIRNSNFGLTSTDGDCYLHSLNSIEYVHGSLKNPPLIFGVNDTDQIKYIPHRSTTTINQMLVKPIGNKETHSLSFERCKKAIRESDIICTYGMSIGETDSLWWNEILALLFENKKFNLIIHQWNPACEENLSLDIFSTTTDCRNKFVVNAKSQINTKRSLTDRIHVAINKDPFNIKMNLS